MPSLLYLAIFLIIVYLLLLFLFISRKLAEIKKLSQPDSTLLEWVKTSQQTFHQDSQAINARLDNAAKIIAGVQRGLGEMSEIGRGMSQLQELLMSPKLRGNIGEQVLRELLGQMLPKNTFHLQYSFKSGSKVDAAIKTSAGIIPVDSKFPLENFRRLASSKDEKEKHTLQKLFSADVKKHIDDISAKYILTEEGTIDYALMYLPSEAIYYEVVNNPDVFDYAAKKRVLPVSPMTFYAYLKAILMSFEGQKIEEQARRILTTLRSIKSDYQKTSGGLALLNKHLQNAYNQMANVTGSFNQLGQKLSATSALEPTSSPSTNDRPQP